jgi:hypothetical protein
MRPFPNGSASVHSLAGSSYQSVSDGLIVISGSMIWLQETNKNIREIRKREIFSFFCIFTNVKKTQT